eukprot:COSAG01_NODE_8704_length_2691_cov_1.604552_2_plen_126_part_00
MAMEAYLSLRLKNCVLLSAVSVLCVFFCCSKKRAEKGIQKRALLVVACAGVPAGMHPRVCEDEGQYYGRPIYRRKGRPLMSETYSLSVLAAGAERPAAARRRAAMRGAVCTVAPRRAAALRAVGS